MDFREFSMGYGLWSVDRGMRCSRVGEGGRDYERKSGRDSYKVILSERASSPVSTGRKFNPPVEIWLLILKSAAARSSPFQLALALCFSISVVAIPLLLNLEPRFSYRSGKPEKNTERSPAERVNSNSIRVSTRISPWTASRFISTSTSPPGNGRLSRGEIILPYTLDDRCPGRGSSLFYVRFAINASRRSSVEPETRWKPLSDEKVGHARRCRVPKGKNGQAVFTVRNLLGQTY